MRFFLKSKSIADLLVARSCANCEAISDIFGAGDGDDDGEGDLFVFDVHGLGIDASNLRLDGALSEDLFVVVLTVFTRLLFFGGGVGGDEDDDDDEAAVNDEDVEDIFLIEKQLVFSVKLLNKYFNIIYSVLQLLHFVRFRFKCVLFI